MKFKKSQSGRSMVEMLGVLAIIGVLSVGGIAGYSLSMRRHRANGIVDILSKYALVAYSSCQQKLLDREVTSISECVTDKTYFVPYFENAGLGDEPAGVDAIIINNIRTDTTSGVDIIAVSAEFDNDKLCQAVASIAGTKCIVDGGHGFIKVNFKQN